MSDEGRTVVVAGGGYSGVLAANRLRGRLDKRDKVLLVSPSDALLDRIRLHQCAVHGTRVSQPYRRLLARGVELVQGKVVAVDAARSRLSVEEVGQGGCKRSVEFAALVLALGSAMRSSIPSLSPLALALQDEWHALQLAAALPKLPGGARVLVVGGGLSAIELVAELAEAYPQLAFELVTQRFADGLTQPAAAVLLAELRQLGVAVKQGVRVRALEQAAVVLEDGTRLDCTLAILAAGFVAAPLPAEFGLATRADGRIEVDANLRALGHTNVFVAGDLAAPPAACVGSGLSTTRMSCATAMPLGAHAADQIARQLRGEPLQPYTFSYVMQCVSLGRRRGVVTFVDPDDKPTGRTIRGRRAALVKEGICRMVLGALRLERWLSGLYAWPRARTSAVAVLGASNAGRIEP